MAGRVVAELIRKPTRAGGSFYFVGVGGSGGQQMRISLFFTECRANDAGEVVEVWARMSRMSSALW